MDSSFSSTYSFIQTLFFIINWSGQTFICSLSKKASREEHCKIIYSILLPQSLLYFHPSFYDLKANLLRFLSFPVISCSKGGCSYEIALNMFLIMSSVYVQVIPKSQNLRLFQMLIFTVGSVWYHWEGLSLIWSFLAQKPRPPAVNRQPVRRKPSKGECGLKGVGATILFQTEDDCTTALSPVSDKEGLLWTLNNAKLIYTHRSFSLVFLHDL